MPIMIVTISPKPGKFDEVAEVFTSVIPTVHEEPGCERYALHRSEYKMILIEKWTDEGLNEHRLAPSLAELRERSTDIIEAPWTVLFIEAMPAGDLAKGTL
jgi:quinol monooxygenase YgiN